MMCIIVLLPDPDGPTIATNSPWTTSSDTSRRASTGTRSIAYVRLILSRLTMGLAISVAGPTEAAATAAGHDKCAGAPARPRRRSLCAARPRDDDVTGRQSGLDLNERARDQTDRDGTRLGRSGGGHHEDRVVVRSPAERRRGDGQHTA